MTTSRNSTSRKRQHKSSHTKTTLKYGGGKRAKRVRQFFGKFVPSGIKGLVRREQQELNQLTPPKETHINTESDRFLNSPPVEMIEPEGSSEEQNRMGPIKKEPSPIPTESEEERATAINMKVENTQSVSPLESAPNSGEYVSPNTVRNRKKTQQKTNQILKGFKFPLPPKTPPTLPPRQVKQIAPMSSSEHIYDVLPPRQPSPPKEVLERLPTRKSMKKPNAALAMWQTAQAAVKTPSPKTRKSPPKKGHVAAMIAKFEQNK